MLWYTKGIEVRMPLSIVLVLHIADPALEGATKGFHSVWWRIRLSTNLNIINLSNVLTEGPVLKLKRSIVLQNCAETIEELYDNAGPGHICK